MSLFVNIVNLWFTWKWTLPKYCITPLSCPLIATRSPIWYPIKPSSEYKFLAEFLSVFFFSNELWNLLPSLLTLIFLWYLLSVSADVLLLPLWTEAVFAKVSCRSNLNCFFLIFLSSDLKLYRVLTKFIMVTITLNSSHHHNEWLVHLPHKLNHPHPHCDHTRVAGGTWQDTSQEQEFYSIQESSEIYSWHYWLIWQRQKKNVIWYWKSAGQRHWALLLHITELGTYHWNEVLNG